MLAFADNVRLSSDSIRAHKLRAALTVLGLTMGVVKIDESVVELRSREFSRIVVRIDSIDAAAMS